MDYIIVVYPVGWVSIQMRRLRSSYNGTFLNYWFCTLQIVGEGDGWGGFDVEDGGWGIGDSLCSNESVEAEYNGIEDALGFCCKLISDLHN